MKQVYRNIQKCCISLHRLGNQYKFVSLQIKYLSTIGTKIRTLDGICDFRWTKNDILDDIFVVYLIMTTTTAACHY